VLYDREPNVQRHRVWQTKLQKRLTSHFTTLATFTWAKLMTDNFGSPLSFVGYLGGAAQDWRNMELEHSLSQQDVSHEFTWQTSYDLPIGRGRALQPPRASSCHPRPVWISECLLDPTANAR
jgi:hypothetical protein